MDLPLGQLFDTPTLGALAEQIAIIRRAPSNTLAGLSKPLSSTQTPAKTNGAPARCSPYTCRAGALTPALSSIDSRSSLLVSAVPCGLAAKQYPTARGRG